MSQACQRSASREERIARTHLEGYGAPASALAFQPKIFKHIITRAVFLHMLYPG